ncbi:MAG: YhcH/YjgK/YiaL family protein [Bacteroidales bacterium]|nr:YhcH/YjgK/YiaL family protein [Bacteroidales bacterium]MBN2633908.1 YhcH/YjgK/YiaL family protein [Bacteroidales bacterium]
MKNLLFKVMVFTGILGFLGCKSSTDPSSWSDKQIDTWFEKGEWLNGWNVKPDASINRKTFALSYFKHKDRWDKAFSFMKESDLENLELKRYEIDGDLVYAPVSEYITKNEEDARFESHRKYIDLQYVVSGRELIGHAPASEQGEILEPYSEANDIMFMTVGSSKKLEAIPDRFFLFFPDDLHAPGMKDGENSPVRKVVVKIRID